MNRHRLWLLVVLLFGSLLVTGSALAFWLWILPTQAAPQVDPPCVSGSHSGTISSDQRWCKGDNHTITNDVIVAEGVTLIISPGVTVGFNYSYPGSKELIIQGTLIARGASTETILFTSNDSTPAKGDWQWIYFGPYSVNNVMDYVTIRWAGNFPYSNPSVKTETSSLTIDHTTIERSDGEGLEMINASPTIRNTIFQYNDEAAIYQGGGNCFPVLENLQAINNGENAIVVAGATISQNYTWGDAGISTYATTSDVTVQAGVTLTIAPGSKVLFNDYQDDMTVLGTLHAAGTFTLPIRISSRSATPSSGNWGAISFSPDSLDNVLDYMIIEYGNGVYSDSVLHIQTSSLLLDHATIRKNGDNSTFEKGVITISDASPTIRNTIIQDNTSSAIYFNSGAVFPQMSNLSASGNTYDAVTLNTTTISQDYTWGDWGIDTLRMLKSITINQGSTLTITPGVTVKISGSTTNLVTSGSLVAEGTSSQPILFTSTSNTPSKGAWGRISFETTSSGNKLAHTTVEYGGGAFDSGASVYVKTSSLVISDTIVINSAKDGIRISDASPIISNTLLQDNNGSAIYFSSGAVFPQMSNLSASGNTYDSITVNTTSISQDYTWGGWGIDTLRMLQSITIDQGIRLTITPGTTVKVSGQNTSLVTRGRLVAEGTPDKPILFTSTDVSPSKGAWGRISFEATSSGNKLIYVTVEYGGGGYSVNESVYINTSSVELQHTAVINSGKDGIRVSAATPFIWLNQIYDNNGKGVNNVTTTQNVFARCNWWGSPSGPTHSSNPSGTGEDVSDWVTFNPWLLGPEEECHFYQLFLPITSN